MNAVLFPGILVALLLSACGIAGNAPAQQALATDCGVYAADGASCFQQALSSCSPATVMFDVGVPPVRATITGPASGGSSCQVGLSGVSKDEVDRVMLANSASQYEVNDMNSRIDRAGGFGGLVGKTADCTVGKLKADEFASSYMYECFGPLTDDIKSLGIAKAFN